MLHESRIDGTKRYWKVEVTVRLLVNAEGLRLKCVRMLHEDSLVTIAMSESVAGRRNVVD